MNINQNLNDAPLIIGETNIKQAKISQTKLGKLQYILTKGLYADPITAVIAEIANNGIDSVVQAGKDPVENPVMVEIGTNEKGAYFFRVTDKGLGLDKDSFENILMNYLESTKENDPNSIGFFGLGSKSFLSLERSATFTCRKLGKEYKYLAYQGAEFCEYDLLHEIDTDEEDGVIFEMGIKDYSERNVFITKAKQKLAYYDTVALIIDKLLWKSTIFREKEFQFSTSSSENNLHLCLKDVYYPIDFAKLGIGYIGVPLALRFTLGDGLSIVPSRENLIYNEKVKTLILNKIGLLADYVVEKYNESVTGYESFLDAYPFLNENDRKVAIIEGQKEIRINDLFKYSSISEKSITVKGITHREPGYYKVNMHKFNYVIEPCAVYEQYRSRWKGKKVHFGVPDIFRNPFCTHVIVDNKPTGNIREYLKEKHGTNTYFIKIKKLNLSLIRELYDELDLRKLPQDKRKGALREFLAVGSEIYKKYAIEELNITSSQDFIDWVAERKKERAEGREKSPKKATSLNKMKGDITIAYARPSKLGNLIVFKKAAFPISKLHQKKHLTVYFTEEEKEVAAQYYEAVTSDTLKIAIITKGELKRLPKLHNFKTLEQFMADSKPFMRIATAILFEKVVEDFDTITGDNTEVFKNCLTSYYNDSEQLRKYSEANLKDTGDDEVKQAILEVAREKDLFDKSLWDCYLRVKEATTKFDFVTCFVQPDVFDDEQIAKYKRVINRLLLFQKKYHGLEGYEIVKSPEPVVEVSEGSDDEDPEPVSQEEIMEEELVEMSF